jgi:hypothetical protein
LKLQVGQELLPAAHGQLGQDLLELGHVPGHHRDQVVHLPGDQVGRDHLRHRLQHVLEGVAGPWVVPGQGRRDVDRQGEARRRRVQPGGDRADHAGVLEVPHAMQGGSGGQPDGAGQLHVCNICIRLEHREQMDVNFIKLDGHSTES